ncbi:MAG: C40 family peptidase [Campylobacterales bacterium]|nr:C40 family peptidase [Campylobacterales bacterium]
MKKNFCVYSLIILSFFLIGCNESPQGPKPYCYPNYDIIKPETICKPNRENIQKLLDSYLGKPYVWAEEGPYAFDCSGLTYNIYGSMGVEIPRVAREQAKIGKNIPYSKLYYGDLIFFGSINPRSTRISHVGIYLGDGWFAHASSKDRKVTISNFAKEPVYFKRIKMCKRYLSKSERSLFMTCDAQLEKMKITDTRHTTPWQPTMKLPLKAVP